MSDWLNPVPASTSPYVYEDKPVGVTYSPYRLDAAPIKRNQMMELQSAIDQRYSQVWQFVKNSDARKKIYYLADNSYRHLWQSSVSVAARTTSDAIGSYFVVSTSGDLYLKGNAAVNSISLAYWGASWNHALASYGDVGPYNITGVTRVGNNQSIIFNSYLYNADGLVFTYRTDYYDTNPPYYYASGNHYFPSSRKDLVTIDPNTGSAITSNAYTAAGISLSSLSSLGIRPGDPVDGQVRNNHVEQLRRAAEHLFYDNNISIPKDIVFTDYIWEGTIWPDFKYGWAPRGADNLDYFLPRLSATTAKMAANHMVYEPFVGDGTDTHTTSDSLYLPRYIKDVTSVVGGSYRDLTITAFDETLKTIQVGEILNVKSSYLAAYLRYGKPIITVENEIPNVGSPATYSFLYFHPVTQGYEATPVCGYIDCPDHDSLPPTWANGRASFTIGAGTYGYDSAYIGGSSYSYFGPGVYRGPATRIPYHDTYEKIAASINLLQASSVAPYTSMSSYAIFNPNDMMFKTSFSLGMTATLFSYYSYPNPCSCSNGVFIGGGMYPMVTMYCSAGTYSGSIDSFGPGYGSMYNVFCAGFGFITGFSVGPCIASQWCRSTVQPPPYYLSLATGYNSSKSLANVALNTKFQSYFLIQQIGGPRFFGGNALFGREIDGRANPYIGEDVVNSTVTGNDPAFPLFSYTSNMDSFLYDQWEKVDYYYIKENSLFQNNNDTFQYYTALGDGRGKIPEYDGYIFARLQKAGYKSNIKDASYDAEGNKFEYPYYYHSSGLFDNYMYISTKSNYMGQEYGEKLYYKGWAGPVPPVVGNINPPGGTFSSFEIVGLFQYNSNSGSYNSIVGKIYGVSGHENVSANYLYYKSYSFFPAATDWTCGFAQNNNNNKLYRLYQANPLAISKMIWSGQVADGVECHAVKSKTVMFDRMYFPLALRDKADPLYNKTLKQLSAIASYNYSYTEVTSVIDRTTLSLSLASIAGRTVGNILSIIGTDGKYYPVANISNYVIQLDTPFPENTASVIYSGSVTYQETSTAVNPLMYEVNSFLNNNPSYANLYVIKTSGYIYVDFEGLPTIKGAGVTAFPFAHSFDSVNGYWSLANFDYMTYSLSSMVVSGYAHVPRYPLSECKLIEGVPPESFNSIYRETTAIVNRSILSLYQAEAAERLVGAGDIISISGTDNNYYTAASVSGYTVYLKTNFPVGAYSAEIAYMDLARSKYCGAAIARNNTLTASLSGGDILLNLSGPKITGVNYISNITRSKDITAVNHSFNPRTGVITFPSPSAGDLRNSDLVKVYYFRRCLRYYGGCNDVNKYTYGLCPEEHWGKCPYYTSSLFPYNSAQGPNSFRTPVRNNHIEDVRRLVALPNYYNIPSHNADAIQYSDWNSLSIRNAYYDHFGMTKAYAGYSSLSYKFGPPGPYCESFGLASCDPSYSSSSSYKTNSTDAYFWLSESGPHYPFYLSDYMGRTIYQGGAACFRCASPKNYMYTYIDRSISGSTYYFEGVGDVRHSFDRAFMYLLFPKTLASFYSTVPYFSCQPAPSSVISYILLSSLAVAGCFYPSKIQYEYSSGGAVLSNSVQQININTTPTGWAKNPQARVALSLPVDSISTRLKINVSDFPVDTGTEYILAHYDFTGSIIANNITYTTQVYAEPQGYMFAYKEFSW